MSPQQPHRSINVSNPTGCLLIVGPIMTIFFIILSLGLRSSEGDAGDIRLVTALFFAGLIMTLIGLFLWYSRYLTGTPNLTISSSTLRVGEPFTIFYRQKVRRSVTIDTIQIQLVFRETATYQQGTDTRTVTHSHVIDPREIPAGHFRKGDTIEQHFEMEIPADAMHTVDVRRNKLRWYVTVKVTVPRLPDINQDYELIVLPEVAR